MTWSSGIKSKGVKYVECMVSFTTDVKSLYTVIPNDCGLEALSYFLDKRNIKEPSTSTLTRLAELVLTLNSFSFNSE